LNDGKFEIICNEENEIGMFTAYSDRSIRIKFTDRTLLKFSENGPQVVSMITSLGESITVSIAKPTPLYKPYIDSALEFFHWAFSSVEERLKM
jgi:hypothetical protein